MNFTPSSEQQLMRESVRRLVDDMTSEHRVDDHIAHSPTQIRSQWSQAAQLGCSSLLLPEDLGGHDRPLIDLTIVAEEFGRGLLPLPLPSCNQVALALALHSETSKRASGETLADLVAGEHLAAWCALPALDSGWDAEVIGIPGRMGPDAGIVLSGEAVLVPNAALSDSFLVTARIDEEVIHVLIPAGLERVSIERMQTLDLTRDYFRVRFDEVEVRASDVVTRDPSGEILRQLLYTGTVLTCADTIGICERLLDMTVKYASERVAFGRPIASYQAIKHKCADMLTSLESARVATYRAALATEPDDDRDRATAVAKAQANGAGSLIAGEALQIHGGIGFTWEHPLHLYMRRAKANAAMYGTARWHRERLIRSLAGVSSPDA